LAIKIIKGSVEIKAKTWIDLKAIVEDLESDAESQARDWLLADGWKE
jgi:hypothetical protein